MASDGDPVPPGTTVTHVGHVNNRLAQAHRLNFWFRSRLREGEGEDYMSVIAGRIPIDEAVPLICPGDRAGNADATRYALTEDLLKAGFDVQFRPMPTIPNHVAVTWDGEWGEDAATNFCRCFTEYIPGPEVMA